MQQCLHTLEGYRVHGVVCMCELVKCIKWTFGDNSIFLFEAQCFGRDGRSERIRVPFVLLPFVLKLTF